MLTRLIVTFRESQCEAGRDLVSSVLESTLSDCTDVLEGRVNIFLAGPGLALVHASPGQHETLVQQRWAGLGPILAVEQPKKFATSAAVELPTGLVAPHFPPTKTTPDQWTGRGIKLAILDTGLDPHHPDFLGRVRDRRSFVSGTPADQPTDGHGHGTHCIGIAAGGRLPLGGGVYGIATGADLYVGKVLDDLALGDEWEILLGLCWAVRTCDCDVVLLPFNSGVQTSWLPYERMATWAKDAEECLIVGAAGNCRSVPVGQPANADDIMAIGALQDPNTVWSQSSPSGSIAGSEVNLAAFGDSIRSSWKMPARYATCSGTSMAAAFVAGAAALWAEQSGLRGQALWNLLTGNAAASALPREFVGDGRAVTP